MLLKNYDRPLRDLQDVIAFEKEAEEVWLKNETVYNAFCDVVSAYGEKTALTVLPAGDPMGDGAEICFNVLHGKVNQAANMFLGAGLASGETVSYLLPICPQAYYTLLGAEAVGIVNAVNPMLEPEHIEGIASAANATILVVTGRALSEELWAKAEYLIDNMPRLKAVYVLGGNTECDGKKILPFDQSLAEQPTDKIKNMPKRGLDDIIGYYHTGGTTGVPKLAPHTNRMQLIALAASGYQMGMTERYTMLAGLPLFHISGSIVTGIVPMFAGATLVLVSPQGFRDPLVIGSYWRLVDKYKVSILGGVPTMLSALLNIPIGDADISSLRIGVTGGSAAPVEVLKAITEQSGTPMLEGYGMTETTSFTTMQPRDGELRFGSVGLRAPYVDVKAVHLNPEGKILRDADVNEIGIIVMKGTCVMPGYVQKANNAAAFAGDGWINTGDLGRIDAEGYIWLTGRAKDVIIRSGHNIDPSLIEEALHEHPAVELAAAVGKPDSYAGEMPVAYVQLKPGMTATPEELQDFARTRIAERAANPANIFLVDEMPLTGVGKIFKPDLRKDAIEGVFEQELKALDTGTVKISQSAENDPVHGMMVKIKVSSARNAELEEKIKSKLGAYTVHHEIEWES
ncbi:MAG: acyl-CoA synthetase [Sneathiella sp.]